MSSTELKSSINAELDYLSTEKLKEVEAYVMSLSPRRKRQVKPLFDKPTKLEPDEEISRLYGRFPVPDDFDEKEFIAEQRLKDYLAL